MRSLVLALLILACALAAPPARADGPIVIYGNSVKPPKSWLENGTPRGILVDILHELEVRTGLAFDIRLMPWKRAYMLALEGSGGIFGLSRNSERLALFDYTGVMYHDEMRLVVLRGNEFDYRNVDDLRGMVVGMTRGASYGDGFEAAKGEVFIPSEDSGALCRLRMLLAGRIRVALIGPGEAAVRRTVESDDGLRKNRDAFSVLPRPFSRDPNHIGFAKAMKMGEAIRKIDAALADMWADGTIAALEARY